MTVLAAEEAAGAASSARGARAARTTGATGGRRRGPRKITPDMSPAEVTAEMQARKADAAAGRAAPAPADPPAPAPPPAPATSRPSVSMPAAASTGSGFLLGVVLWAAGLAYLRGGAPEVRRLAAAKFLNKTSGPAR